MQAVFARSGLRVAGESTIVPVTGNYGLEECFASKVTRHDQTMRKCDMTIGDLLLNDPGR